MANVSYYNFFICVEELVVFIIAGDENICPGTEGVGQEEATCTAAKSYPLNITVTKRGMTYAVCFHLFLHKGEEFGFGHWVRECADHACTYVLVEIADWDKFVCNLLIYMTGK